jgi:NIMA (never in mitosis gene a)-related kinase 1/4/5
MDLAEGGDLLQLIRKNCSRETGMPEKEIWRALSQITQGLKGLHDLKIVHRDLKGANIFIGRNQSYLLGDLNVSKVAK